jgi:fructoselysine-6-P-deglycase FrlB-like protein
MTFIAAETASQPACWLQAPRVAAENAAVLPQPEERVAVVGCGTSWFMAEAYASLREAAGQGETDAFAASEMPARRRYDRILAITRSGTTSEILRLLARYRSGPTTVVITGDTAAPVAKAASAVIGLDFAHERSVVQTVFATTALAVLRAHLGERVEPLAVAAQAAISENIPSSLLAAEQYTFLGQGWTNGLAREAALKMRESCQAWTESYPAMEYRHGPISIAAPGRVVWFFGTPPVGLAGEVERTGATLINNTGDPMVDLVRVHRLAAVVAEGRGLDPDRPRHLTRSVVLSG